MEDLEKDHNSPQTLEKKKQRAKLCVKGFREMCEHISFKIFFCKDVKVLSDLVASLRCMYNMLENFTYNHSHTVIGCWTKSNDTYRPLLLESLQMDSRMLFTDMTGFAKHVLPYIDEMVDENGVFNVTRLTRTFSLYLQKVVVDNKVFHAEPPKPLRRPKRSVWRY